MAVMGLKNGVKSFSESPQNEINRGDRTQAMTAQDLAQLGGENIGDVLNKVADPNWVDPSKKMRAVGNDKLDKDAFMKLMLAQMKNQDPTNPMQSHEMAAQLAQFSSVEQLGNINDSLNELKQAQKPAESFQALNFIGKAVAGDSAKIARVRGDKSHDVSFKLPSDASDVTIKVKNPNGDLIRTVALKNQKAGDNAWTWNGLDENGKAAPAGDYSLFFEAKAGDKKLSVQTAFEGMITGVNYTSEGPVLLVGTQSVKLKDVKKIVDPSLMKNGQKSNSGSLQDLNNQQAALNNKGEAVNNVAGDPELPPAANIMNDIGMSNELMAKVAKETKPEDLKPQSAQNPAASSNQ